VIESPPRTAYYVYGVVALGDTEAARAIERCDAAGVGGTDALELVECGPLAAVVGAVTLEEFNEAALTANLNDRVWLERNARAHEDVLQAVAAVRDVVPFRFGTICRGRGEVRDLLDARRDELQADLERVRGCVELGVKIWLDRDRLDAALAPPSQGATSESGRGYLEARRAGRQRAEEADRVCDAVTRDVYELLLQSSVEGVANRPQPRELTGRSEEMLLNAAFLVPAGEERLAAEVERANRELASRGITLELTGPWPPHNFVGGSEGDR
jgi:hypothetical protein